MNDVQSASYFYRHQTTEWVYKNIRTIMKYSNIILKWLTENYANLGINKEWNVNMPICNIQYTVVKSSQYN